MTIEEKTKSEETKDATEGTSDFCQWSVFVWKLIRPLAVIVVGMTVIYLVCKWLIY